VVPSPALVIDFRQSGLGPADTVGVVALNSQTGVAEYKEQYNISYEDTTLSLPVSTLQTLLPDMHVYNLVLLTKNGRTNTISNINATLVSKTLSCNSCFLSPGDRQQTIAYENPTLVYQGVQQQDWQVVIR